MKNFLLDNWIRAATSAAARQLEWLSFGGHRIRTWVDPWRSRRCEDGHYVRLRVQIATTSGGFEATLESAVVAFVAGIRNEQVVTTLSRSVVKPAIVNEVKLGS